MATPNNAVCTPMPVTPLSFSLLISSPIRKDLPFSPTTASLLPLARVKLPYAGLVVAALDILIVFLNKRSLVVVPPLRRVPSQNHTITLTLDQLADLINRTSQGQMFNPSNIYNQPPQTLDEDEPLFPDNLSFSLTVSGPLGNFNGTPDSAFNVPLFEIPGAPGNLIIALITITAQFYIEQANINGSLDTPARGGSP